MRLIPMAVGGFAVLSMSTPAAALLPCGQSPGQVLPMEAAYVELIGQHNRTGTRPLFFFPFFNRPVEPGGSERQTEPQDIKPTKEAIPKAPRRADQKPRSKKRLSCEAAVEMVGGYGFSDVKSTSCGSSIYAFTAMRDGSAYSIEVTSSDGEISRVRKQ